MKDHIALWKCHKENISLFNNPVRNPKVNRKNRKNKERIHEFQGKMAQFSARFKQLISSEGTSLGLEPQDPLRRRLLIPSGDCSSFGGGLRSIGVRIRKRRVYASSFSSSASTRKPKDLHRSEADYDVSEDENSDEDDEYEVDDLSCFRGLVLDISYRPVNVVCWKRAICLEFMEKADVLEYYDQTVNSPSGSFYIPAVLRVPHLLQVVKRRRVKNTLSRKNILIRDDHTCQYCTSRENLTIDHVLPISRGGEWTWENLVTACSRCNSKKGQKKLEEANMKLLKVPKAPKEYDILAIPLTNAAIRTLRSRNGMPEEWRQYLAKPSSNRSHNDESLGAV